MSDGSEQAAAATTSRDQDSRDDRIEVTVLRIPVALWARTQEHLDEVFRECTLIAAQLRDRPEEAGSVPVRLTELVEELTRDFAGMNTDQENRLARAAEEGVREIDLVYRVPSTAGGAVQSLQDMLDEVDAYCLGGDHLLTLASPPELAWFRRWMLGEFACQLSGGPPTPYPQYQG